MLDLYTRGRLMLMGVEILVIDEADRMLDMGFIPDIEKICTLLPPKKQTLFFSATMPTEITRLVNTFLNDPVRIEVARPATTATTIVQQFRFCPDGEDYAKREVLRDLIKAEGDNVKNAIIFCNRKRDVAILLKSLVKHGYSAGALHGDMDQKARTETLDAFRAGKIAFLAASDVAARGLDIPEVSHVFNFDVPWAGDDYVHRIGRTGRAGRAGTSLTLVAPDDLKLLKDIEKATAEQPTWIGTAPTPEDFSDGSKRKRRAKGGKPPERGAARGPERGADRGRSADRPARPGSDRAERPTANRAASSERPRRNAPRPGGRNGPDDVVAERRPPRRVREPLAPVSYADGPSVGPDAAPVSEPPRQDRPERNQERGAERSLSREGRPLRDQQEPREQTAEGRGDRRPPRRQPPRPVPATGPVGDQPDVAGWPSLTPDGPVGDGAQPRRVPPRENTRDGGRDGAPREYVRRDTPNRDGAKRTPQPRRDGRREAGPTEPRAAEAPPAPRRERAPDRAPERAPDRAPVRAPVRTPERTAERGSERSAAGDRPRNDRRPHRGDQSDGPPSGFTDNVPAFLRKPPAKTKPD